MMGQKRTKEQRDKDRAEVAKLYLRGVGQYDIADQLGVNQSTVSRDLKALQKQWQESALVDIDEMKARELAKIDELERTYWDAWVRSCEDAEVERQKKAGTVEEPRLEVTKEKRGQTGDPRFLSGVKDCINMRREIFGIDAPKKNELTGKDGTPIKVLLGALPDEELDDIIEAGGGSD
jgi:predicted transcriptional regulator